MFAVQQARGEAPDMAVERAFVFRGPRGTVAVPVTAAGEDRSRTSYAPVLLVLPIVTQSAQGMASWAPASESPMYAHGHARALQQL